MAKRTAVIDIGSNSVRMVIFEKTSRFAFHLLHEVKSRVRISEGAYDNNGNLQDAAIKRAVKALKNFLSIAQSYDVRKTLCVATSAVRDAPNKKFFLLHVKQETGLQIKVLDGEKESYYGGVSCANLFPNINAITLDIGGGSTESSEINNHIVSKSLSINLGTVRLKELFFDHDDVKGAKEYIDQVLKTCKLTQHEHVIGVGGTIRALSQAMMQRSDYPLDKLHGFTFTYDELIKFGNKILKADEEKLKQLGIKKDRFDVIKPGTLILMKILKLVGCKTITTSGVGVREGVYLHDLLRHNKDRFPEHFNPSVRYLLDNHTLDTRHANQLSSTAKILFDLLSESFAIPSPYRYELSIAAKVSHTGESLHFYSYHQNSYYLIKNALEYGFSHQQIMLIATLVRFQKRKRPTASHIERYEMLLPDEEVLSRLSYLLSLANTLLIHRPKNIDFRLSFENGVLIVNALDKPLYLASEAHKSLSAPTDLSIHFL
ncbi:MAG: Ppx/GppA family phosphatase [Epsilonproteobacteria bacterium]|nr:MAG: Ppx/GppA family phosphatase [Campylobacterota bacterium]